MPRGLLAPYPPAIDASSAQLKSPHSRRPRRRKLLLVFLAGVGATIVTFLFLRDPEPSYKGKPLRTWLSQITIQQSSSQWAAQEAIEHIGTNSIPYLLNWISAEGYQPSRLQRLVAQAIVKFPTLKKIKSLDAWTRPEKVNRYGIPDAFEVLGPRATSVIPTLMYLATSATNQLTSLLAAQSLSRIGPTALPALNNVLTNQLSPNRQVCIMGMGYPGASAAAAAPFLVQCLNDQERSIVVSAVSALSEMRKPDPQLVIPALTNLLSKLSIDNWADLGLATTIARVLRQYDVTGYAATPALVQFVHKQQLATAKWDYHMTQIIALTESPEVIVPYFTRCLESTNESYAIATALSLPELGPPARLALPALTNALQNSTGRLHLIISNSIQRIVSLQLLKPQFK